MRDFDQQRANRERFDRTFKIGGHVFTYRAHISPEVVSLWDNLPPSPSEQIVVLDNIVLACLEGDDPAEWRRVRSEADDAVSLGDIISVVQYLMEASAALPTDAPESYSGTPAMSGIASTATSSYGPGAV